MASKFEKINHAEKLAFLRNYEKYLKVLKKYCCEQADEIGYNFSGPRFTDAAWKSCLDILWGRSPDCTKLDR
jgi:hypothetical protein